MKQVKKYFKQLFLLNKRLAKKKSFLAIWLMIPLLAVGMQRIAGEESGVLHILLYGQKPVDALTEQIIDELVQMNSVILFERAWELEQAYEQVQAGKADAVWIFSDMQRKIEAIFQKDVADKTIVKVVEQADTVALHLAREKLYGVLYPYLSYELFEQFINDTLPLTQTLSEEELRSFYEETTVEGNLFRIAYTDYRQEPKQESSYLFMPMRGILVIFLFLCGAACAMYVQQDRERGIYLQMSGIRKFLLECGSYLVVTWSAGLFAMGAFWYVGIFTSWKQELSAMMLYGIIIAGLCYLLRRCLKTTIAIGVSLPVFAVLLLVCSPVFLHTNQLKVLQSMLPTYHYLQAVHQPVMLIPMLWYAGCVWGIAATVKLFISE